MVNEIHTLLSNPGNTVDSNGAVNNLVDLLLEKGTFNDLNNIESHIDVYERI